MRIVVDELPKTPYDCCFARDSGAIYPRCTLCPYDSTCFHVEDCIYLISAKDIKNY